MKIDVLDDGHVSLVDHMGSDLTVVNAARVSFDKESKWGIDTEAERRLIESGSTYRITDILQLRDKDAKLIDYLASHAHWTPFAHPQIILRMRAPVFIRTQCFKHKQGFVENEISRRYVDSEVKIYMPKWRGKPSGSAKQGSSDFMDLSPNLHEDVVTSFSDTVCIYHDLIAQGIAPEQARSVLPQGMYTEWYWTGSLAAYARFYNQRSHPDAQWEIRQYAEAVSKIIQPLFPHSWRALTGGT